MANDVTFRHPDYCRALPDWVQNEDAAAGERAIKGKQVIYLPKPNAADTSEENRCRYDSYLQRAVYFNATGRTLASLIGLAFRKWPTIELPSVMEEFQKDVTGSGVTLVQHAQGTVAALCKTGRAGVLVDYPRTEGAVSVAEQSQAGLQPTFAFYPAEAITNWRTTKRGSKVMLSLVVLWECDAVSEGDGFEIVRQPQYRVLRLAPEGYVVEIWQERDVRDGTGNTVRVWDMVNTFMPLQANGQRWSEIPFQFFGSQNNDTDIDPAPLTDLAVLNIAHFRNSADFEDSVYMLGQGQIWCSGVDEMWVKMLKENGIYFGSRAFLPVPTGGQVGLIQMDENTLVRGAMDQKEKQMAALGARLLMLGSADAKAKTATQVDSEDAAAHSVLSLCCDNTSQGYEQLCRWALLFQGATGTVVFSIGTEFIAAVVDAQLLTSLVGAVQAGKLPLADFWEKLRSAGLIRADKADDEIREEIAAEQPATTGALDDVDEHEDAVETA